jgi:putative membrane protein
MDTDLANDRTYLAWLRTAIALFGLGFVVSKIALIVGAETAAVDDRDLYSAAGIAIVLTGAALVFTGYLQHRRVFDAIHTDVVAARPTWPRSVTLVAVLGSVLLSVLIVIST